MSSPSLFKIRDSILDLGRKHDPGCNWSGTGNFQFEHPTMVMRDAESTMLDIKVNSSQTGLSTDARIIVRNAIGDSFTEDGKYRAFNMNLDWQGSLPISSYQPDSCFVQLKSHHFDDVITFADLYCGGFGGWQHASEFLATHFEAPQYLWSIDRDPAATKCHSMNFGEAIFSEESVENYPLPSNEKFVVCGNCDYVFLNHVNFQKPTRAATASFPCPPWSRGSKGKGFEYHDGGLAILEILRAGMVKNWEFILLENVDAILEHFHFAWIRTYIEDSGYYIAYSNVSCIGEISPAKRKRWVCILVQQHHKCRIPATAFEWRVPYAPTLKSCNIIPSFLPDQHEKDLTLNEELLRIYGDPSFAPMSQKTRFTIDKRIKHGYEQMSTATATYGRQHDLPNEIMRSDLQTCGKGIYADLIHGKFGIRFWSPIESAMTMIIFKKTLFPIPLHESHQFVGNAISTLHAIKVFCAFLAGCSGKRMQAFEDIYHTALRKRLHMGNSRIYIQDDWIVVEPLTFRIEDIEISMTLPMPRVVVVIINNTKKELEIPVDSTIDHMLRMLEISPENVFVSWKPAHICARTSDQKVPDDINEFIVSEKYQIYELISEANLPFAQECIRRVKASTVVTPPEPMFFPVHVFMNGHFCLTLRVWAGVRVQLLAEICWASGVEVGCELLCLHLSPALTDERSNVGFWGLSKETHCEIHVITKQQGEHQLFSIMTWDDTRKSPLLGQRIGEASHPGPDDYSTVEFKTVTNRFCVRRSDINTRISQYDIATKIGVRISGTKLWDPINQLFLTWDQLSSCKTRICHVVSSKWTPKQTNVDRAPSFWDFLPTMMPVVTNCRIERKSDFTFGTIHRLTKNEIFNEQFQKILHDMNARFTKTTSHSSPVPIPVFDEYPVEDLLWHGDQHSKSSCETNQEIDGNWIPFSEAKSCHEPEKAAGRNKRCCNNHHATDRSKFWIHLPLGRYCAIVAADDCKTIDDLVKKAFQQVKIPNYEFIMKGCYCCVGTKTCDFQTPVENIPGTVIRIRLRGLLGGGKDDIMRAASARLGELLIHKDLPINAVASKVQKIIEKLGLSQIHQAIQNQNEIHAWRKIELLAQNIDFVIFNEKEKKSLSATLIQRAIKKKKKGNFEGSAIAIDQFTIPLGIFINGDHTETPILPIDKLRAGSHGVCLTTEEKITPWIQSGNKSSADELGIVFLGNPTHAIPDVYEPTPICFAAVNHNGKECILRGTLLQLGGKKVSLNQHFKVEGANASMTTCSLTAYAADFEQDSFSALISSPAKYMLSQLPSDTIRNAISAVWGRSFMRDGKKVANLEADSVQVHISIKSDNVPDLLKCSGTCNVYITPKTASGLFDPKYHLIWTDLSKVAIEQKANEIQNHLGYIRGRKGFALRFLTADAPDGFKSLFPSKTFEPPIAVIALYKLQPVPYGILPEVLVEACKAIKWNIKPIKRSGNSWLIGADKHSPNKFLIIDGTTILVKEVEKTNNGKTQICLAGPRPKMVAKDNMPDPFIQNDPWAGFKPSTGPISQPVVAAHSGSAMQPTAVQNGSS